jgi:hypothetical protein
MSFIGAREHGAKVGSAGVASDQQQVCSAVYRWLLCDLALADVHCQQHYSQHELYNDH